MYIFVFIRAENWYLTYQQICKLRMVTFLWSFRAMRGPLNRIYYYFVYYHFATIFISIYIYIYMFPFANSRAVSQCILVLPGGKQAFSNSNAK